MRSQRFRPWVVATGLFSNAALHWMRDADAVIEEGVWVYRGARCPERPPSCSTCVDASVGSDEDGATDDDASSDADPGASP